MSSKINYETKYYSLFCFLGSITNFILGSTNLDPMFKADFLNPSKMKFGEVEDVVKGGMPIQFATTNSLRHPGLVSSYSCFNHGPSVSMRNLSPCLERSQVCRNIAFPSSLRTLFCGESSMRRLLSLLKDVRSFGSRNK